MERIATLLFATTAVLLFSLVVFFVAIENTGNGGVYWGFDRYTEPYRKAVDSFDAGDYRFLSVDMRTSLGKRVQRTYYVLHCDDHPLGMHGFRVNTIPASHGHDSLRLAAQYSYQYNRRMSGLLHWKFGLECETEWMWLYPPGNVLR